MKTTETTTTCPKCGLVCQGPRIRPHNCAKRQAHPEHYLSPNLPRPAAPSGPDSTGRKGGPAERQAPAPGTLSRIEPQPLAVSDPAVPLHNLYHRNAMLSTAQAACWIVLAGAELKRSKKLCGHGNWEKWVADNCEYDIRTAQKYIALTEGVKNRVLRDGAKANAGSFLEMLETPAALLTTEQQRDLLKCVHNLTDGETIQQLYLDFGIVKDGGAGDRKHNKGGFQPSKELLLEWIKSEYPDHPEYLGTPFDRLPEAVQDRFSAEGPRYRERLGAAAKAELEREAQAQIWVCELPEALKVGLAEGYPNHATVEQLRTLAEIVADLGAELAERIRERTTKRPALKGPQ